MDIESKWPDTFGAKDDATSSQQVTKRDGSVQVQDSQGIPAADWSHLAGPHHNVYRLSTTS